MLCPICQTTNHGNSKHCKSCHQSLTKPKPTVKPKCHKRSWPLSQKIALLGIIATILGSLITALATLAPIFSPEIQHLFGFDQTISAYRLKQKYSVQSAKIAGNQVNSGIKTISIDGETPEGDVDGHFTNSLSHTLCQFTGKVTSNMHFSFQCFQSNQKFNGYIYANGGINGDLENTTSLIRLNLSEASKSSAPNRHLNLKNQGFSTPPYFTSPTSSNSTPTSPNSTSTNSTPIYIFSTFPTNSTPAPVKPKEKNEKLCPICSSSTPTPKTTATPTRT